MDGIKFRNLTLNKGLFIPMLPEKFTIAQKQGYKATPIIGGYPHIQITAQEERKWTAQLDLYGREGETFFKSIILPSYGQQTGQPHLIEVAWGEKADEVFRGRPVAGMPETDYELGKLGNDLVFAWSFSYELVEIRNQKPRVLQIANATVNNAKPLTYTVQQGDDLGKIARQFGVTVQALAAANKPTPAMKPPVGTVLIIPRVKT